MSSNRIMLKTTTLSFVLIFLSYLSYSQTVWKRLDLPGLDAEDTSYAYQPSSLMPYNEPGKTKLFKVWIRKIERKITLQNNQYRNIKSVAHMAIDCANREYRLLSVTYYDTDGTMIQTSEGHANWEDAVPESEIDIIMTSICPIWKVKKK